VIEKDRDRVEAGEAGPGPPPPPAPPVTPGAQAPGDVRNVSFSTAVRGYDRRDVDRYVQRVNRIIAELEITQTPESAVRHALDRVGKQTSGILQRARETADEIIHTAGSEAADTTARGEAEAREIVADARSQADRVHASAEEDKRERVEEGSRELEELRRQGEETQAQAEMTVARANSQANELVDEANVEAEQIVARAHAQIVESRTREEQRLDELRRNAESTMRALRADTDAIEEERRCVFQEIHELAARLERLVDSPEEVDSSEESDQNGPTALTDEPVGHGGDPERAAARSRDPARLNGREPSDENEPPTRSTDSA
jgi:DivIVA domain-containing protein